MRNLCAANRWGLREGSDEVRMTNVGGRRGQVSRRAAATQRKPKFGGCDFQDDGRPTSLRNSSASSRRTEGKKLTNSSMEKPSFR
jgi:hypothetical protein